MNPGQRVGGLMRAYSGDMAATGALGQTGLRGRFFEQAAADFPEASTIELAKKADLLYRAHMTRLAAKGVRARS